VTAIVRSSDTQSGDRRLRQLMRQNGWPSEWNRSLHVIEGSLADLFAVEPSAIEDCDRIIHCAAALNFDTNRCGEPWRTNVDGTMQLGRLAAKCGIRKFVYVSTAYACGQTQGHVYESVGDFGDARNDYEASKQEAERWLVQDSGLDWIIARPGIVVGDSRTGRTGNYMGIYRVLKSIARLCDRLPTEGDGHEHLPLRLGFTGNETSHLIPIDFVSSAIVSLALRDDLRHECVHLTPDKPTTTATLLKAVQQFHNVRGIEFVGPDDVDASERNAFERIFDRETKIVSQYFENDPVFDPSNRRRLIPDFPSTPVDVSMLMRLQAFGKADDWGNVDVENTSDVTFDCIDFFSRHFPAAAANSQRPLLNGLSTFVRFEIRGARNGQWLCRLEDGRVVDIVPANRRMTGADFLYQTDARSFQEIVAGELNVRQAFFDRRINISGDIERALLLAVLFEDLLLESPYHAADLQRAEANVAREKLCA